MPRFRKDDIEFHSDGFRAGRPAVNVKVYASTRSITLPLVLGLSRPADAPEGTPFTEHRTDDGFTHEWIDEKLEADFDLGDFIFQSACESGWEWLTDQAQEIFGAGVKVYSEGRSGGWAIVDGIDDDVDSWDAIAVSRWGRFVKAARAAADDVPYQMVTSLYMNEYEQEQEQTKAQGQQVADLIVAGGH